MSVQIDCYVDGGTIKRNPSPYGGVWAWLHVAESGVVVASACGVLTPTKEVPLITNNYAEYVAAVRALLALPPGSIPTMFTDSKITLGRLCKGWATKGLPPELVEMGRKAMERTGGTFWHLLAGHPTKAELAAGSKGGLPVSEYNVRCDEQCRKLANEFLARLGKAV